MTAELDDLVQEVLDAESPGNMSINQRAEAVCDELIRRHAAGHSRAYCVQYLRAAFLAACCSWDIMWRKQS